MKKEYEDYIIKNAYKDLNSLSNWVSDFCDNFDLKIKWSGLHETNATFSKTLKSLELKGLIRCAFKCKMDRGWGHKGGCINHYTLTTNGYEHRNILIESSKKGIH